VIGPADYRTIPYIDVVIFPTLKVAGLPAFSCAILLRMGNDHNPTFDSLTSKPDPYTAVVLFFSDGTRKGGIWTGQVWWSEGQAVDPERWQRMPRMRRQEQ
jgi:hypothetical protein